MELRSSGLVANTFTPHVTSPAFLLVSEHWVEVVPKIFHDPIFTVHGPVFIIAVQETFREPVTYCYLDSIVNLEEFLGNVGIVAELKVSKNFPALGS